MPPEKVWRLSRSRRILITDKSATHTAQISEPAAPIPLLAFDLMMGCLRLQPQDRLNICQVKDHPWLAE